MIKPANRTKLIKEYYFSAKLRKIEEMNAKGNTKVINLGVGNPDMPPSDDVINELSVFSEKPGNHGYQKYNGSLQLRSAFSYWYKKYFRINLNPDDEILPLIGSKEGILHISMAFLNPGDKVLVPDPGYPAYSSVSGMLGAEIIKYNLIEKNNWYPDLNEISHSDLKNVKLMWINYPNMPTGAPASHKVFKDIIDFGWQNDILICNDNPYSFILNDNPKSIFSISGSMDIALELNSLSKSHNMAGWRIGAVMANKKYIQNIITVKSNVDSGMFLPMQMAGAKALYHTSDWYDSINDVYSKRRKIVWNILDSIEAEYNKQQNGMFVWARVANDFQSGEELSNSLLCNTRVFITPGSVFGENGKKYIRISLCTNENKLKEALKRIVQYKKQNNGN